MLGMATVDVMEVFSPQRPTKMAPLLGLRPGWAVDLEELKPCGSERWNLDKPEDVESLMRLIEDEDPYLLTGSPPCEAFSRLLHISRRRRDPEAVAEQKRVGRHRLQVAIGCYRSQMKRGRLFLHEHPDGADSWQEAEMVALLEEPGVIRVRGPMCRWDMEAEDRRGLQGRGYVRKMTGWVTNCKELAELLEGECSNLTGRREWRRHIHLIGGIAKGAQVYPPKLVKAI